VTTAAAGAQLTRVYVWQLPVRLSHWLIFGSIMTCSATGIYIGHPFLTLSGEARQWFVMGWARAIHLYSGFVFIAAVLMRVIWMFTGNKYAHWDKFVPVHASRLRGLMPTIKFYLFALRKPPGFIGHNPIAGLTYVAVFGLYGMAILSGLTLYAPYAPIDSPFRLFLAVAPLFGGLQMAHWIHHVVMWLLLGFAVHHVYSGTLMSTIEATGTMESIFSGYKFVPREDLEFSGYRFINRQGQIDE
jgi:Ni/Fe-hydrogenase 1 B-type cytochrome subunit